MKVADFFRKPRLMDVRPVKLPPGKAATFCASDCGRYLVSDIRDLDRIPSDWTCEICHTNALDSYLTHHTTQPQETH